MPELAEILAALPDYEIGGELGRGGFGLVREGRHKQLRRAVAIKELPAALAADPRVRARFAAEARVLASLSHPHIVPIFDYVERDGVCLLVMEKLPGGTLWGRFKEHGLGVETTCAHIMAVCAGLHYAHQRGVLHRDIKPENLLYSADGVLKITDFGIAKVVGGGETLATRGGEILGTPAYMAPEQAEGRELGPPADVYATGVMLYELLSGRLPFSEEGGPLAIVYRHVYEDPAPLQGVAANLVPELVEVTMRAISRSPADRYDSCEAFGVAIGEAVTPEWGPDWLAGTDMQIVDSGPISESAKRPTGTGARTRSASTGSGSSTLIVPGQPTPGPVTPGPPAPGPPTPGPVTPGPATPGPATPGPATPQPEPPWQVSGPQAWPPETQPPPGWPPGAQPTQGQPPLGQPPTVRQPPPARRSVNLTVVRPLVVEHVGGAGPGELGQVDFVPVRQVIELPSPPYALAAAAMILLLVAIAIAFIGAGKVKRAQGVPPGIATVAGVDPTGTETLTLDLAKPIEIRVTTLPANVTAAQLGLSVSGIALPSSTVDRLENVNGVWTASPTASASRYLAAGTVTAELRLVPDRGPELRQQFPARGKQSAFLTIPGVLTIALLLFLIAYMESLLRSLRRGKRQWSSLVGMALLGALLGATMVPLTWLLGSPEPTITTGVICAVCGGGAGVAAALAAQRIARRARIKPKKARA